MKFMSLPFEDHRKRFLYMKIMYFVGAAMSAFYIYRFAVTFAAPAYNDVLIPLFVTILIGPPLLWYRFKMYRTAAVLLLLSLMFMMIMLIHLTGGMMAPGIFWLATVPLATAILFGTRGAISGYFTVVAAFAVFWINNKMQTSPNVIPSAEVFREELITNLIVFFTFTSITTHVYLRNEAVYTQNLREKHNDVENLLRVLLHDIANTLSSMTLQLIRAKEEQSVTGQELEKMERAVQEINNLLNQVRHLKSVKDGKAKLPLRPMSLAKIINDIYENAESMSAPKGIKLSLEMSRDKMLVNAEKTILGNVVLLNIISNAVKFSHPGGRIDIRAVTDERHVLIIVQDYGVGIPQDILNNLFDVGSQTSRPGTQGEKGTGYGMPLVKEYIQMLGGSIEVTSAEMTTESQPQGTKVTLRLPLAE
ncbi:HAMP domain-containing histidine kinase [Bdellovibrio sp. SKB1291214]|uniref:sensor histidine kinase n=1 Tax=Bdellovibrio sp. SKB1291214 TaxID=1732569 RepID=UPI0020CCAAFB|nr:HAMP domain-containing sensor histidine kinase [Bdellovibrio sp. SKB1291214]UYL09359.1 HAMP domain-containing histidine kinase [Bdellovibrio sp. SKB1291214]